MDTQRLRIAIQKSGRMAEGSNELLQAAGLRLPSRSKTTLFQRARNLPIDLLLVRDDDIPHFVATGVADIGIVGENVYAEWQLDAPEAPVSLVRRLGFSFCRLCLATPKDGPLRSPKDLEGKSLATSYPLILQRYFKEQGIKASVMQMSGSVEVAPKLGIADGIFDIVSSGATLEANGLGTIADVFHSEALLIQTDKPLSEDKARILARLLVRIESVQASRQIKYIMLNAPQSKLATITDILPGADAPTVLPLQGKGDMVAIHAVVQDADLWDTLEKLKAEGASSILVTPIEKMMA